MVPFFFALQTTMCQTSSMASPQLNPNPKPLNPNAASFSPMVTSPENHKNELVLPQKRIYLPYELYHQPLEPHGPLSMMSHGLSYYTSYMCEPGLVLCPNPHVVFYNTLQQPPPVTMPYYVGYGDEERGAKEEVEGGLEVSTGILGCGHKRKVGKRVRRVVGQRSMRSQRRDTVDRREKCWVPKEGCNKKNDSGVLTKKANEKTNGGVGVLPSRATPHGVMPGGKTSVMIRNIPNQYRRQDMLCILDKHCYAENTEAELRSDPCRSAYDLFYLPMDFGYDANLGYAFVNFTNAVGALRFSRFFHKYQWPVSESKKTCEINWAKHQGKDALRNHFLPMKFECRSIDYLPAEFSPPRDGWVRTRPTVLGTCVHSTPRLNQKMEMLSLRRRKAR